MWVFFFFHLLGPFCCRHFAELLRMYPVQPAAVVAAAAVLSLLFCVVADASTAVNTRVLRCSKRVRTAHNSVRFFRVSVVWTCTCLFYYPILLPCLSLVWKRHVQVCPIPGSRCRPVCDQLCPREEKGRRCSKPPLPQIRPHGNPPCGRTVTLINNLSHICTYDFFPFIYLVLLGKDMCKFVRRTVPS